MQVVSPPHLQSLLRHWCKLRYVTVGVDICTEHRRHNGNPVRCNEQRKFCKTLTIRFRASSFALVSERVLNVLSSMMVLAVSELCCFRASIPLTADIGDTFSRRSLHRLAIGAHFHVCKHGPQQVDIVVTRAQMGVVPSFWEMYVPLRICRTLYARAMGDNIHSLQNSYFSCVKRFQVLRISCEVTVDCHFTGIITLPGSFLLSSMMS